MRLRAPLPPLAPLPPRLRHPSPPLLPQLAPHPRQSAAARERWSRWRARVQIVVRGVLTPEEVAAANAAVDSHAHELDAVGSAKGPRRQDHRAPPPPRLRLPLHAPRAPCAA